MRVNLGSAELIDGQIRLTAEVLAKKTVKLSYDASTTKLGQIKNKAYALIDDQEIESGETIVSVSEEQAAPASAQSAGQKPRGKITRLKAELVKAEKVGPQAIKADFEISGRGGDLVVLLWQSRPFIQTFKPLARDWQYQTELIMPIGRHTLLVGANDQNGRELNQIGPLSFNLTGDSIDQPIVIGQLNGWLPGLDAVTLALGLIAIISIVLILVRFHLWPQFLRLLTKPIGLTKAKQGLVYDASDKKPVGWAIIRLYDKDSHRLVATRVTGKNGRYGFVVKKPGRYHLTVIKKDYRFPAKGQGDFYRGQSIVVKSGGKQGVIAIDLPVEKIR